LGIILLGASSYLRATAQSQKKLRFTGLFALKNFSFVSIISSNTMGHPEPLTLARVVAMEAGCIQGVQMLKSIAAKSITGVFAVALGASLAAFLSAGVPNAEAATLAKDATHQTLAKGDRLSVLVKGAPCSVRSWPNYEQRCQFDQRGSADDVRTVRVIALR
jgi:hypothetical protein